MEEEIRRLKLQLLILSEVIASQLGKGVLQDMTRRVLVASGDLPVDAPFQEWESPLAPNEEEPEGMTERERSAWLKAHPPGKIEERRNAADRERFPVDLRRDRRDDPPAPAPAPPA